MQRFDELYKRLEPDDILDRVAWLFNNGPQPPTCKEQDWEERAAVVEALQRDAVQSLASQDANLLFELAAKVEHPRAIGFALGQTRPEGTTELLARTLGSPNLAWRQVGQGLLFGRSSVDGAAWLEGLRQLPQWSAWDGAQKTDYFLALPFSATTWALLRNEEPVVQDSYWRQVGHYGRGQVPADDRDYAAEAFVKYGRIATAVEFLSMYSRGNARPPNPTFALELLEHIGQKDSEEREVDWGRLAHAIGELLDIASGASDAPLDRIARLEWRFLRLLQYERPPKVLHAAMSQSPSLFVDVLKLVYRARAEQTGEVSPHDQLLASLGHDLLEDWTLLPGGSKGNTVNADELAEWVRQARELAATADLAVIADSHVGRLLSHAPLDADNRWPHVAVRSVVEHLSSEAIERGMVLGVYNSRGVVSRTIGEGGVQERELAAKYRSYGLALVDQWPRTARVLHRIADTYEKEARHEDLRAEIEDDDL